MKSNLNYCCPLYRCRWLWRSFRWPAWARRFGTSRCGRPRWSSSVTTDRVTSQPKSSQRNHQSKVNINKWCLHIVQEWIFIILKKVNMLLVNCKSESLMILKNDLKLAKLFTWWRHTDSVTQCSPLWLISKISWNQGCIESFSTCFRDTSYVIYSLIFWRLISLNICIKVGKYFDILFF